MVQIEEQALKDAARRAYERGRLKAGARIAIVVVPLAIAAVLLRAPLDAVLCLSGLLLVGGTAVRWWGRSAGPAVLPGIVAGTVPLIVVPLVNVFGNGSCVGVLSACSLAAAASGLVGGLLLLQLLKAQRPHAGALDWGVGLTAALATSCVSCFGLGGPVILSASLGLALGSIGVFVPRTPTAE